MRQWLDEILGRPDNFPESDCVPCRWEVAFHRLNNERVRAMAALRAEGIAWMRPIVGRVTAVLMQRAAALGEPVAGDCQRCGNSICAGHRRDDLCSTCVHRGVFLDLELHGVPTVFPEERRDEVHRARKYREEHWGRVEEGLEELVAEMEHHPALSVDRKETTRGTRFQRQVMKIAVLGGS